MPRSRKASHHSTILCLVLVCFALLFLAPSGAVRANPLQTTQPASCSDSIQNCRRPVKFISKSEGCYTFACEYGLPTQHNIHTDNAADVKTLFQMQ